MTKEEANKEMNFEEAMEALQKIVEKLEEGDVPLEKAIEYYQEGMKLSKFCSDKLLHVEKQMEQIVNQKGEFEPFTIQEEK